MALMVNEHIALGEDELSEQFFQCSGPGGQHVNKTESGVRLLFSVVNSPSLPEGVRARLLRQAKGSIDGEGTLAVTATRFRERERNRMDARRKLAALIAQATIVPKHRVPTRPGKGAIKRRLDVKARRSETKQTRRKPGHDD